VLDLVFGVAFGPMRHERVRLPVDLSYCKQQTLSRLVTIMSIKVLLLGATGETGKHTLTAALSHPSISSVHAIGRRPPSLPSSTSSSKLVTTTIDFDLLLTGSQSEITKLKSVEADVVVITLGTTSASAGSFEQFVKVDREYVLAAAKAARVEGKKQRIIYLSSGGSSSGSPFRSSCSSTS